ncbi:hypothetical protein DAEQUDRAFT_704041 [Daedalea quercina L-15889]|uniref:RRM domain-containing protein n=1 Tax=Daedalea quercina L-15889 TaxID=1314783 RepID=A0A165T7S6_9APHY|nr:hypothetical protein DAEQUDRAFT_704041 [Daedalea quercina L-15889]
MAPGLLDSLKKKKSKEAISAKAAQPAPAESSKADSQKRKRKSHAEVDHTPSASTSAETASTSEPIHKKSQKKADAQAAEPVHIATKGTDSTEKSATAGGKKGKGREVQSKDVEVTVDSEKMSAKKKTFKEESAKPTETKRAKQEKSAKAPKTAPPTDDSAKPAKRTSKASNIPLAGISHPTMTSKSTNKKRRQSPEPEPEPSASDDDEESTTKNAEDADEEGHLYGFSTDDADSSDEEIGEEWGGIDVGKLPTIAKDDAVVKKKLEKAKRHPTEDCGVIYLGRVPHGFYEDQMRQYFSQFGTVTRLRLSRNKKTGRSKHYAFIEFDSSSVAQIVADTMDNYLLMGHILTCKVIPKGEVHPELWIGANRKWRVVPRDRIARVQHNKPRTEEEQERAEKRLLRRQAQRKRKLEEAGINYDFSAVAYKKPRPVEA